MGQDIREMMQTPRKETAKLSEGHEDRFEDLLAQKFPKKEKDQRTIFFWMKLAASVLILLSIGYFGYNYINGDTVEGNEVADTENTEKRIQEEQGITLGDISPALAKVEEFYTTGINVQLASLEVNDDNKELIEGYMKRLRELDAEYQKLNKELNEEGPSEATVSALIDNLKLRMDLLFKLKNKLKELKELENEQFKNMA